MKGLTRPFAQRTEQLASSLLVTTVGTDARHRRSLSEDSRLRMLRWCASRTAMLSGSANGGDCDNPMNAATSFRPARMEAGCRKKANRQPGLRGLKTRLAMAAGEEQRRPNETIGRLGGRAATREDAPR